MLLILGLRRRLVGDAVVGCMKFPGRWQTKWACESIPWKRRWIHEFMHGKDDRCIFTDVCSLRTVAECSVHKQHCSPVRTHIAIAGFSCKTLSKANKAYMSGSASTALRDASGTSGETFLGVLNTLEECQPPVWVGENVEDLGLISSDNRQALLEVRSTI